MSLGGVSSGGATFVTVVQAAYFAERHNLSGTGRLDRSRIRRVFAQGEVRPRSVVVGEVRLEDHAEVRFAEDDDVIQAVAVMTSSMPSPAMRFLNAGP